MRDHVAEAVGASKSKLARLKVIRDRLESCWWASWEANKIGESVAYALAQLPGYWQTLIFNGCSNPQHLYEGTVQEYVRRFEAISKTRCGETKAIMCRHQTVMMEKSCKDRWSDPCKSRCCWDCPSLRTCKDSCKAAYGRKNDLKKAYRTEAAEQAQRTADRDRPKVQLVDALWQRFGLARELAGKDWRQCKAAMDCTYFPLDDEKVIQLECGEAKVTPDTKLPYWVARYDVERLIALADFLGCSLDYLLCRTDVNKLTPKAVSGSDSVWQSGTPEAYGTYAAYVKVAGAANPMLRELLWDGEEWLMFGEKINPDVTVQCWADRPDI
jgi:ParB family chromosome partitioning protein